MHTDQRQASSQLAACRGGDHCDHTLETLSLLYISCTHANEQRSLSNRNNSIIMRPGLQRHAERSKQVGSTSFPIDLQKRASGLQHHECVSCFQGMHRSFDQSQLSCREISIAQQTPATTKTEAELKNTQSAQYGTLVTATLSLMHLSNF